MGAVAEMGGAAVGPVAAAAAVFTGDRKQRRMNMFMEEVRASGEKVRGDLDKGGQGSVEAH